MELYIIIGMGIIITLLSVILITKQKTPKKQSKEIERLNKILLTNKENAKNYSAQINNADDKISLLEKKGKELFNANQSKERTIQSLDLEINKLRESEKSLRETISVLNNNITNLKTENVRLNNTVNELREKEKLLLKTISDLNQTISNLKNENAKLNGIITNHKNSIPTILNIRKDNTDLLFFYRELIHTIVYYNPVHTRITNFNNDLNSIDDNLKRKEIAIKFGECLEKLDFSEIDKHIKDFSELIIAILYSPFHEVGEQELGIHNVKRGEIFCQKVLESIAEIITTRKSDLETIGQLHQILSSNYERWKKILSRNAFVSFLRDFWEGFKIGIINQEYGFNLGDILHSWEESYNLSDDDFVELYNNTITQFIETSFLFTRNMDIDFTAIEVLYQEYQEIENSLLQEKIQIKLTTGDDISNIYSIWRKNQSNILLKGTPYLAQQVIEELKTKKIEEKSIDNIKNLVCADCFTNKNS